MYGKIPERKLKQTDYILSCQEARRQLDEYMDHQNKRVNIDSAKKMAVIQHMDYEGFRQMVLGANIFPTKSKQLSELTKGQHGQPIPIHNKAFDEKKQLEVNQQLERRIEGNSQKHCLSFRDFKKKFVKNYDKELNWQKAEECYSMVTQQNQTRLEKIFNLECEADLILKILEVFKFVLQYLRKEEKNQQCKIECGFMVKFLQTVLSIPTMQDISLNILTKKQREKIAIFLEECKAILPGQEQDVSISKVINLIRK